MVAEYTISGDSFVAQKPRLWADIELGGATYVHKDLAPDGKRFVIFPTPERKDEASTLHVTFLLNLPDELRRRIPLK